MTSNEFVQFINEDVQQFVRRLKEKTDGKDIWLMSGQLLDEGSIDHSNRLVKSTINGNRTQRYNIRMLILFAK